MKENPRAERSVENATERAALLDLVEREAVVMEEETEGNIPQAARPPIAYIPPRADAPPRYMGRQRVEPPRAPRRLQAVRFVDNNAAVRPVNIDRLHEELPRGNRSGRIPPLGPHGRTRHPNVLPRPLTGNLLAGVRGMDLNNNTRERQQEAGPVPAPADRDDDEGYGGDEDEARDSDGN